MSVQYSYHIWSSIETNGRLTVKEMTSFSQRDDIINLVCKQVLYDVVNVISLKFIVLCSESCLACYK